jgi:hypothetical protein
MEAELQQAQRLKNRKSYLVILHTVYLYDRVKYCHIKIIENVSK